MKKLFKKSKKILSVILMMCLVITGISIPVNAADKSQSMEQAALDATNKEISELGLNIIDQYSTQIQIQLSKEFIDKHKDQLSARAISSGVAQVYVDWKISYTQADGLGFYTTAYSQDITVLLKSMYGMNTYDKRDSYASGFFEIKVINTVPFYRISHYQATYDYFSSGSILDCFMQVDINALNEISGGYFSANRTVTIP